MGNISSYKDLLVWQKGIAIVKEVYLICKNEMPKDELYSLQSQIKRAAVSIPSNIAEGYGRQYTKSYIQFLKFARGSLLEVETQIIIAKELNFITTGSYNKILGMINEESKMLNSLIRSISK